MAPDAGTVALCEPEAASVPDHAPLAAHEVALVELQVSEVLPPIADARGFADRLTVGNGKPVIVAVCAPLPPVPVQVNV